MSKELVFYISSSQVSEPSELEETISVTYSIKNIGDEVAQNVGFYLKSASSLGDIDYYSYLTPGSSLLEILKQGDEGFGLAITQSLTTTRFRSGIGDNYFNRIPLTIGTGSNLDQIEPNAEIQVDVTITFKPGTSAGNYYIDFVVD